ncbi:type IV pilin N-terminal domain-containing protein [Halorubellus sp. PRR65]|uniref:type IV pilin N-terminal domain-containing protein n=1 Tax=Halorubellus sp. PRR65 TaxID=3098148 RepID=UPI002B26277F|nr:type IV pilin N-terminal domain-containing protein [Halorubellus sp. PRR65]
MKVTVLFSADKAVSSTIGVVLMVAVTVILAAAVGSFALGLAEESTKKTPTATVETEWGVDGGSQTVDITIIGGDSVKSKFMSVTVDGTVIWKDSGVPSGVDITTIPGKTWTGPKIESGDTLGLKETSNSGLPDGKTLKVIWNNGQKSQVLGTGTVH